MTEDTYNEVGFVSDRQWLRTSASWKSLIPKKNFNELDENDESITEYCKRVARTLSVPTLVAEQWLYSLYSCGYSTDNYGWLNFTEAQFKCLSLNTTEVIKLHVIEGFEPYTSQIALNNGVDSFACIKEDKEHWKVHGTWRVPPVVVEIKAFPSPPSYADFSGKIQLVEGHTRLGYFKALHSNNAKLAEEHDIYLLTKREYL